MMIEAIIIDDEPKAIELLEHYCERSNDIYCKKSFRNPIEALEFIENNHPQLIFVDINMPKLSGIQLAKLIPSDSHVVFTTAYPEYAVESYNLNATDYLLKPILYHRFLKAVHKVLELKTQQRELQQKTVKRTIVIKSGYEKHQLLLNDILYLEKDGNYMVYHTKTKKILARETIAMALEKLPASFIQVHKSFIISVDHVDVLKSKFLTINSTKIPLSSRYKSTIERHLN
ncbi:LytR/AlgR family response regulator transcription factor [Psychroserpens sp. MEBiC05023]